MLSSLFKQVRAQSLQPSMYCKTHLDLSITHCQSKHKEKIKWFGSFRVVDWEIPFKDSGHADWLSGLKNKLRP